MQNKFALTLICLLAALFLLSCAPMKFETVQLGDKFDSPVMAGLVGYTGKNNRLSMRSSQNGIHLDDKGIYLNPYVYKSKDSGQVKDIGFFVYHYTWDTEGGFLPIQEIIFLTDTGKRVAIPVEMNDQPQFRSLGWNSISHSYNSSFTESASAPMTLEQFTILAQAASLEAKIIGGQRIQTYENGDVLPEFVDNLKSFYNQYVAKGASD